MKREKLTNGQKEVLRNLYVIRNTEEVFPCFGKEQAPLTRENFLAMAVVEDSKIVYLNADDFEYYDPSVDDYDFKYTYEGGSYYLKRDFVPTEIRDFLDKIIKQREV